MKYKYFIGYNTISENSHISVSTIGKASDFKGNKITLNDYEDKEEYIRELLNVHKLNNNEIEQVQLKELVVDGRETGDICLLDKNGNIFILYRKTQPWTLIHNYFSALGIETFVTNNNGKLYVCISEKYKYFGHWRNSGDLLLEIFDRITSLRKNPKLRKVLYPFPVFADICKSKGLQKSICLNNEECFSKGGLYENEFYFWKNINRFIEEISPEDLDYLYSKIQKKINEEELEKVKEKKEEYNELSVESLDTYYSILSNIKYEKNKGGK